MKIYSSLKVEDRKSKKNENEKAKVFYAKMRTFLGAQQSFSFFFASLLLEKV